MFSEFCILDHFAFTLIRTPSTLQWG